MRRAKAVVCTEAEGDHVAIIGENRKLLIFPLTQVPEMTRGKGVRLQRYKDGGISDAKVFKLKEGLTWKDTAGRTWTVAKDDLRDWIGNRAEAGRLPPKGFPKSQQVRGVSPQASIPDGVEPVRDRFQRRGAETARIPSSGGLGRRRSLDTCSAIPGLQGVRYGGQSARSIAALVRDDG